MAQHDGTRRPRPAGATVTAERTRRTDPGHARATHDVHTVRGRLDGVRGPQLPAGRSFVRDFVAKYGWRAHALPILAVITVVALATMTGSPGKKNAERSPATAASNRNVVGPPGRPSDSSPPLASGNISLKNDAPAGNVDPAVLKGSALPPGPAYTTKGEGTFRVLAGTTKVVGDSGRLYRYDIEVENGITGVDLAGFQTMVDTTLDDPRSWTGHGVRLQRADSGQVDFHITLTSSLTVRKYCGYSIPVETSCYAPAGSSAGVDANRVVLNVARWVRGATAYLGDVTAYRHYMINHEDGHAIGHNHAHQCLPNGLAPAMMQQTFGLRSAATDKMCQANPWPYPPGTAGAPGAEQQDTPENDEYGLGD